MVAMGLPHNSFSDEMSDLNDTVRRLRRIIGQAIPVVEGELERITERPCDRELGLSELIRVMKKEAGG